MGNDETFPHLLEEVNARLEDAVSRGDYEEIARLAGVATEIRGLEQQERAIAERRRKLAELVKGGGHTGHASGPDEAPRVRGEKVRNHYVDGVLTADGIHLELLANKKYRTSKGETVGMTYAKELGVRTDSWFLGLADERFDIVILLCESYYGEIAAFILPNIFVRQMWDSLSRSQGQVKFHVTRKGTTFKLRVPGHPGHPINQYLNATDVLR